MSQINLWSPPISSGGPQRELWKPMTELGDALAFAYAHDPSNTTPQDTVAQPQLYDLRDEAELTHLWRPVLSGVLAIEPNTTYVNVRRYTGGNKYVQPWHTDTRPGNMQPSDELPNIWDFEVYSHHKPGHLIVLDGKTTECLEGLIQEDTERVSRPGRLRAKGRDGAEPSLAERDAAIERATAQRNSTLIGSEGQIIRLREVAGGEYPGRNDIVRGREGDDTIVPPHTVHRAPPYRQAGCTVLYFT